MGYMDGFSYNININKRSKEIEQRQRGIFLYYVFLVYKNAEYKTEWKAHN